MTDDPTTARLYVLHEAGPELACLAGASPEEHLNALEQRLGDCVRDGLGWEHFALRVLDNRTGQLDLIASCGVPEPSGRKPIIADAEDNGIAGYVATTSQSYLCPDVTADGHYRPLDLPDARCNLSVPVRLSGKTIGVLTFESPEPGTFADGDIQPAEVLAGYVAVALCTINLLAAARNHGAVEVAGVVSGEFTGPITDIRGEAELLIAQYVGHEDLCKRLRRILGTADCMRETVRQITEQPGAAVMFATPAVQADPILGSKRVLVADDEELIRQTVRDVLVQAGASVETASDGAQAIQAIQNGCFDLVISDIKMPHCDGYEVFAAARRRRTDTAVILITGFGYDPGHSIVRANAQGLSAVLFKPFKVKELLDEVRAALT